MACKLVPPKGIMVPLNSLFQPTKKARSLFNRFLIDVAKRLLAFAHLTSTLELGS